MTDFGQENFEPRSGGGAQGIEGHHPDQIERAIVRTRERMAHDVEALGERLAPRNLARHARDAAGKQARRTGARIVAFVRANPLPVVAVGLGALWWIARRR